MYSLHQTARLVQRQLSEPCMNGHEPDDKTVTDKGVVCTKCQDAYQYRNRTHSSREETNRNVQHR